MYVKHKDKKKKSNPVVRDKWIFLLFKDPGKSSSNKIINWDEQKVVWGKQTVTANWPKDNLGGIQELSSPENTTKLIEWRENVSMRSVVLLSYEWACSRRSDSVDITKNSEQENTAKGWG